MATILLNEVDPSRKRLLETILKRRGHQVMQADEIVDISPILRDHVIDLLILDLDSQNLSELYERAGDWKGTRLLLQSSWSVPTQDFRCWVADSFVCKDERGENISHAVEQLLSSN